MQRFENDYADALISPFLRSEASVGDPEAVRLWERHGKHQSCRRIVDELQTVQICLRQFCTERIAKLSRNDEGIHQRLFSRRCFRPTPSLCVYLAMVKQNKTHNFTNLGIAI